MASSVLHFLLSIASSLFLLAHSSSQPPTPNAKPNLVVLPLQKDASSGLHWAYFHKRTPLVQVPLLVDLNGKFLWVNCDQHYLSSTYNAPFCHSTQCSRANTHTCHSCLASASRPGCHNNTCALTSTNPVTLQTGQAELAQDLLAIYPAHSTLPSKLGPLISIPQFLFACAPSFLLQNKKGLPKGVQGVAGLGHHPIALPIQLASQLGLERKFSMCLSASGDPNSKGFVFFGQQPERLLPRPSFDVSRDLTYIPLKISPQGEYYVQSTSIKINKHVVVPVNHPLTITKDGPGAVTMITTSSPYTVVHRSIFEALIRVYGRQVGREAQVKAVAPFGLCFDAKRMRGGGPDVEVEMESKRGGVWRMSGENLMVERGGGVKCLGIVDGGENPRAPIAIGARQLEEHMVVFDLARSQFGFSSCLMSHGTRCANFNFTFTASP